MNDTLTSLGYVGKLNFKLLGKVKNSIKPILLAEETKKVYNQGTNDLFSSLVNFLISGQQASPIIPRYIDIIGSKEIGYENNTILASKLKIDKRLAIDGTYYVVCTAILSQSLIIPKNLGLASIPVTLQLLSGNTEGSKLLAEVNWDLPIGELNSSNNLLIEWRLGFENCKHELQGGDN